jgi:ferredoxin-NADP reductase
VAVPKTAELVDAKAMGPSARWLELAMREPAHLGFIGGQYIIVDTGITLPSGKIAKRAYSVLSSDADQTRFELVVRRIGEGAASRFLHDLPVGSTLRFSGPWGKFLPEVPTASGTTLVVATDTGISAALGLLRATAFRPHLPRTTLLWLTPSADDFVPESFARARVPSGPEIHVASVPPVGHPERAAAGLARLEPCFRQAPPKRVYLAGDGSLLYPFAEALRGAGLSESEVILECFFNNPAKKVGVSAGGDAT